MRLTICAALLSLTAACGAPAEAPSPVEAQPAPQQEANLTVFAGGTIYTGNPDQPLASAILVDPDGRIMQVVGDDESAEVTADSLSWIDLDGAVLYPGFVDSHAHLSGIGERELRLDLAGTSSVAELVMRVEAELEGLEPGRVLIGRGWIETGWPEGRMPVAADLDPVSLDHPVILTRADGHALVANMAALNAAGVTSETPDPEGGRIEKDETGEPNGLLIDTAMGLLAPLMAEPSESEQIAMLVTGAEVYAARGWTGLHNMSVSAAEARLMERLSLEGRLPVRVYNALNDDAFDLAATRAHETDLVTNRAVKVYMDGALGSRGALLLEPYADRPGERGLTLMEPAALADLMVRADAAGVQLAIHAIGDLANRHVLDTYDQLVGAEEGGLVAGHDHRWRIEHAQVIAPEDLSRLAELDVIASMQPSHAIGDLFFAPDRLGLERLRGAYAWRSLLDAGTIIAGGSDAPVEVGSPLIEFYAAVERTALDGTQAEGWHPEEAVTRAEALAMFTSAPAYAAFQEDELGTIEPGKWADFTVFDRDLMTVPAEEILEAEAVMTVVQGKIVWRAARQAD